MTESELREEFTKLSADTRRVTEANDEYRTGLLVDMEARSDGSAEVLLDEQLEAKFEKIAIDCAARFDEVKRTV